MIQGVKYFLWIKKNKSILKTQTLEPTRHYGKMDKVFKNKS